MLRTISQDTQDRYNSAKVIDISVQVWELVLFGQIAPCGCTKREEGSTAKMWCRTGWTSLDGRASERVMAGDRPGLAYVSSTTPTTNCTQLLPLKPVFSLLLISTLDKRSTLLMNRKNFIQIKPNPLLTMMESVDFTTSLLVLPQSVVGEAARNLVTFGKGI